MGMDAEVTIWVGLNVSDYDVLEELKAKLPKDILERVRDWQDGPTLENVKLEFFSTGEEDVGFGVKVFHHDWDFGPKTVDLLALHRKGEELKVIVGKIFSSWGIDTPPDVWLDTDYS